MSDDNSTQNGTHGTGEPADDDVTTKPGGLGEDGTIPPDPDGVAAGHSDEASHFNPEEDEDAPA
ncbi:MAG: hypothetical protein J0I43_12170 [Microbacterium sp.]|uniref:hypothetical protein n=1 Tax=Microbacterium sp. TaxID=51671 RepID=UPI001AD384D8|nr:hypothetical protein [Microbacterium sp.]MBN9178105.1 hypothetical protein [Microbacterium sp.]